MPTFRFTIARRVGKSTYLKGTATKVACAAVRDLNFKLQMGISMLCLLV
jgi:hypothetical protein